MDPYPYIGLTLWVAFIALVAGGAVGVFFLGRWLLKLMGWL
jgi:hypothetical protein